MKRTTSPRKRPMNFRLRHQVLIILARLEKKLHKSKTAVVETALEYYANRKLKLDNPIMRFAGAFSAQESEDMLSVIKSGRVNKEIKIKL